MTAIFDRPRCDAPSAEELNHTTNCNFLFFKLKITGHPRIVRRLPHDEHRLPKIESDIDHELL